MKRFLAASALLVAVLGVLAISNSASATNGVMNDFTNAYPATAGTALANCSTCHTSVPALNPYGSAVLGSGFGFGGIEGLDSDNDGFTNLQEIRALTNPGVASNRPTTPTTTDTTSTTSASNSSTTGATTTTVGSPAPAAAAPQPVARAEGAPSTGAMAFEVEGVGTVWLTVEDGRLVVTDVKTIWRFSIEEETDDDEHEVEIQFRSGDAEIEFEAELEDGTIRTKVEVETDGDHRDHDDDDDRDRDHDDDDDDAGRDHDDDDDEDDDN